MAFEEDDWDRPPGQKSGNPVLWTVPSRSEGVQSTPSLRLRGEQQVLEIKGRWNNCDAYISAPTQWSSPFYRFSLHLYVMIGGAPYHVQTVDLWTLAGPDITVTSTGFRARALRARGRPSDGFRVTVSINPTINVPNINALAATLVANVWGTETADVVEAQIVPGPDAIPVTIDGPLPLPVSGTFVEAPATSWANLAGTAPDGSGGVTVATAIAGVATPVQKYVDVTSDPTNPFGSILYVKSAAGNLASASGYMLLPGATATIEVNDAAKIFVLGSAAGLKWVAART